MESSTLSKEDKEARSIIEECLNHSNLYSEDRQRNFELYEGIRRKTKKRDVDHDHVYKSHIAANLIEQLATFATQALTNEGGNIFRVADFNNVEVARQAAAATVLLNYYMHNQNPSLVLYKTLWEAECFGTGIIEVEFKTTYIKTVDEESSALQMKVSEDGSFKAISGKKYKDVPHLSQPFMRQVRLIDFWVDKQATCVEDLRYACIREVMSFKDVEKMKEAYSLKNLEKAKNAGFPTRKDLRADDLLRAGHRKRDSEYDVNSIHLYNESTAGQKNPKVEVIRIFRPGTIQFVMNDIVISEELIIYDGIRFPFVVFVNDPKPGEFYGRSSAELIRNDVEFHEEMVDLIHDGYLRSLKPVVLADANSFMATQLKEFKNAGAGDIVAINGLNVEAVREIKSSVPEQSAVAFANAFEQSAKNALAITPIMDGGQDISSGVRTQGSFELLARMGSTRIQNKIRLYSKCFEEVGSMMLKIAQIYADKEEYISVTGALGDTESLVINPKNVDTRTKFKVKLGSIAEPNRATKMAQQVQWIQTMAGLDQLGLVRTYKGMVEAAATGDLFEDSVSMIETDPDVISARAFLQSQLAGTEKPGPSLLGSYSSMQPAQPAQGSSIPQMTEGNVLPQQ